MRGLGTSVCGVSRPCLLGAGLRSVPRTCRQGDDSSWGCLTPVSILHSEVGVLPDHFHARIRTHPVVCAHTRAHTHINMHSTVVTGSRLTRHPPILPPLLPPDAHHAGADERGRARGAGDGAVRAAVAAAGGCGHPQEEPGLHGRGRVTRPCGSRRAGGGGGGPVFFVWRHSGLTCRRGLWMWPSPALARGSGRLCMSAGRAYSWAAAFAMSAGQHVIVYQTTTAGSALYTPLDCRAASYPVAECSH